MLSNTNQSEFVFDPPASGVSIGTFRLNEPLLRAAFGTLSQERLYGCRQLPEHGEPEHIGFMDARRRSLARMCREYSERKRELSEFATLLKPRAGLILNSVQDPSGDDNAFNQIGRLFLKQLNFESGRCPEEMDICLFMGSYDRGFGLHNDAYDVTMFVLDGIKGFVVEQESERKDLTLHSGMYLRWDSVYMHSNCNPDGNWSLTMNISLGPAAKRKVAAGTPVEYVHQSVKFKNMIESFL